MLKARTVFALLLLCGMAWGQQGTYTMKNLQYGFSDVTTQTATVNAWKTMAGGGVCSTGPGTLVLAPGDQTIWCKGTDGYTYIYDITHRSWLKQAQFGTAPLALIPFNAPGTNIEPVVYSIQAVSNCGLLGGKQTYGFFAWNPGTSAWFQPQSGDCFYLSTSIDRTGKLWSTGWDNGPKKLGLWYSTNEGASWTLSGDNWTYFNAGDQGLGCGLDNAGGIWATLGDPTAADAEPALPSGTAVGCLYAQNPTVILAWTSTGTVYAMPEESPSSWQAVTGISASTITGILRYGILGEDTAGHLYHWNVNAPGLSGTYGGQWNINEGCPAPSDPCHPTTTHTVTGRIYFTSGHGIGGQTQSSTQVLTNDIETNLWDYNPGCDPVFGDPADPECKIEETGDAMCNQSGQGVGNFTGDSPVGGIAVDIQAFMNVISGVYPYDEEIGTGGVWKTDVHVATADACAVYSPGTFATCGGPNVVDNAAACIYKDYAGNVACQGVVNGLFAAYRAGRPSPWIFRIPYAITTDGEVSCYPFGNLPGEPRWGVVLNMPSCQ